MLKRYATAFGRFWWDFLVGDTPELFFGVALAIGLTALAVHTHAPRAVSVLSLPVLVGAIVAASLHRASRKP